MQPGRTGRPNTNALDHGNSTRGNSRGRTNPDRSRGRSRGRGRGASFRSTNNNRNNYTTVPSYSSISPGTPVSIILKQDQPTGHQVCGIVADLLTRGDHPRGVKVRLRDGRVGRVQGVVSESEGVRGEAIVGGAGAGLGRDGEAGGGGRGGGRRGGGMLGGRIERDIREDDEYLYDEAKLAPAADTGLFAALEEADRRHEESVGGGDKVDVTAVCPVCGVFEGDGVAVARHVEAHFE